MRTGEVVTNAEIARQRLHNQLITQHRFEMPGDVVRWLGAVQAQDYSGSLWAVGLRLPDATEADIERAIADKTIVRTSPMRGTLHFVAPEDIRWIVALLQARSRKLIDNAARYNRVELDEEVFARSEAVIASTLQGGKQLTRRELAAALERAGIAAPGLRFLLMLGRALVDNLICYGVRRGKQQTLTLLDEWLPPTPPVPREEGLARFARRYFVSHGPATVQDFAWWSGLAAADARAGLDSVQSEFVREVIDGKTYWLPLSLPTAPVPTVTLLPSYDEYTVAYKDRSAVLNSAYAEPTRNGIFSPIITVNGMVAGIWKRTLQKEAVVLSVHPLAALTAAEAGALAAAAERYGKFLGLNVILA